MVTKTLRDALNRLLSSRPAKFPAEQPAPSSGTAEATHSIVAPPRPIHRAILYRRDVPGGLSPAAPSSRKPFAAPTPVAPLPGIEVHRPSGTARIITTPLEETDEQLPLHRAMEHALRPDSPLLPRLASLSALPHLHSSDVMLMDLETTGLSCSPLFLAGTLSWVDGRPIIRQFLARHYGHEQAVIALFFEELARHRVLVSFNGKSFDWPFIRTRAIYHRLPVPPTPAHVDLLHLARRAWKGQVPDCRLTTLEAYVCGRVRQDDIPGRFIPDAYHAFVRTGDASDLVRILHHNRRDLCTLAELLTRLLGEPDY
mgnify:CR=1 FL=1